MAGENDTLLKPQAILNRAFDSDNNALRISSSATGDVVGPASSTDNAIPRFDGTGGKTLQNSGVTIDDSNNIDIPGHAAIGGSASVDGNINGSASKTLLDLRETVTATPSGYVTGIYQNLTLNPSSALTYNAYGLNNILSTQSGNTRAFNTVAGSYISVQSNGNGDITGTGSGGLVGQLVYVYVDAGSANITQATSILAEGIFHGGTGVITTARGVWVKQNSTFGSAAITTSIGVDIQDQGYSNITTAIGLRVAKPTNATTNYAIQLSDTSGVAAGGITFGTDTTLYRIAADVLASDDSLRAGGYLRVGSTTAPANTTAGDITGIRFNIGNAAFAGTVGQIVSIVSTTTDTASGASIFAHFQNTFTPASNSSTEMRALNFRNIFNSGAGITASTLTGGHFEGSRTGGSSTGAIGTVNGLNITAYINDSGSNATPGTVTTARGILSSAYGRPSGTSAVSITNATGFETNVFGTGAATITTARGFYVSAPGTGNTITTLVGLDIASLIRGATNIGIRIALPSGGATANYALQFSDTTGVAAGGITFGTDTTLYRSAANTLKTDDSVVVTGDLEIGETAYYDAEVDNGNSSTADTIDWGVGNCQKSTATGSCTYTFTAPPGPCHLTLKITNDGTGGYDFTWPAAVKWLMTEPTWTSGGASKTIIVSFYYDGTSYWAQSTSWEA